MLFNLLSQYLFVVFPSCIILCSKISPPQVETIGDAYMIVSGVPERIAYHGERVADMALDMLADVTSIIDPGNPDDHLKIRIGNITCFVQSTNQNDHCKLTGSSCLAFSECIHVDTNKDACYTFDNGGRCPYPMLTVHQMGLKSNLWCPANKFFPYPFLVQASLDTSWKSCSYSSRCSASDQLGGEAKKNSWGREVHNLNLPTIEYFPRVFLGA